MKPPRAEFIGCRTRAILAALPLAFWVLWLTAHLFSLIQVPAGMSRLLPLSWLVSFLLLWWLPLAWFERPFRADGRPRRDLDALRVTVQVPVYNEDETALRACLRSVFAQSRRVDRIRVVDDGSADRVSGTPITYDAVRAMFFAEAGKRGIEATWDRTENRGKRWAQMHALADDDGDIFVTLDSDSVLDRAAVEEGLKPFANPKVKSVAGLVTVLNNRTNLLTRMTTVLYLPFTRGLRSAQSVLHRVTINSGTLAFYRGAVVRRYAGSYENESFAGRKMQMNDDSMLTFYALLEGDTVHQPSAIAFTLVPQNLRHYFRQQLRWMRGTTVRHLWWLRYMPVTGIVFWATVAEYTHLVLSALIAGTVMVHGIRQEHLGAIALTAVLIGALMQYLMALRLFTIRRSDDTRLYSLLLYLCAPLVALWRLLVLRPLYIYAMLTCRRIDRWGTRGTVEVRADPAPAS